jgi:hypothetical protein
MKYISKCLTLSLFVIVLLGNACGYKERGKANTPPEYPGSQMKVGADTLVHPGNIDRDTLHLHH